MQTTQGQTDAGSQGTQSRQKRVQHYRRGGGEDLIEGIQLQAASGLYGYQERYLDLCGSGSLEECKHLTSQGLDGFGEKKAGSRYKRMMIERGSYVGLRCRCRSSRCSSVVDVVVDVVVVVVVVSTYLVLIEINAYMRDLRLGSRCIYVSKCITPVRPERSETIKRQRLAGY